MQIGRPEEKILLPSRIFFCREIDYLQIIQNRHISNGSIHFLFQMCAKQISKLMSIHARCGHANRSRPVVVQMGQLVGQHLNSI